MLLFSQYAAAEYCSKNDNVFSRSCDMAVAMSQLVVFQQWHSTYTSFLKSHRCGIDKCESNAKERQSERTENHFEGNNDGV